MIKPTTQQELHGGTQRIYKFDNGFGASVVNHSFSYGTELAVVKFTGELFEIVYDTPITNDVIGHLSESELQSILQQIKDLTQ